MRKQTKPQPQIVDYDTKIGEPSLGNSLAAAQHAEDMETGSYEKEAARNCSGVSQTQTFRGRNLLGLSEFD